MPDTSLESLIGISPLLRLLSDQSDESVKQPPIPLSPGHIALMLAAGAIHGPVFPANGRAHVIRGGSRRVSRRAVTTERLSEDMTRETVITRELFELVVRIAYQNGTIDTLTSEETC